MGKTSMCKEAFGFTPRERFMARLQQVPLSAVLRPSVGNAVSVATVELMEATGCFFPRAHVEADCMAGLAAAGHEILGFDTIAPVFSVQHEAASLGCEVNWGRQDLMPEVVGRRCLSADDIVIPVGLLQHDACRVVLDALSLLRRRYPDVALIGKVFGPWTLAYHLFGVEAFLLMTLDDPQQVQTILHRLKDVPVLFATAQFEAGADAVTIADHATGDLVSAHMYREALWPIHCELASRIPGPTILHICGNTQDRLADIARTGFTSFHFESKVPAGTARQIVDSTGREEGESHRTKRRLISLMGNLNNPQLLLNGTPEDVWAAVGVCVSYDIEVVAPECAVPLTTPTANLRAMSEAAEQSRSAKEPSDEGQGEP